MTAVAFLYEIDPARRERFEAVYGPDGDWARFFRTGEGYLGTELRRSADGSYLLLDRWTSEAAYAAFLDAHREEYDRRGREGEALYRRETRLGRFDAVGGSRGVDLELLPGSYAACRLGASDPVPPWAESAVFCAVTRTERELSVICPAGAVPDGVRAEPGWSCLRVAGPLDFAMTGVAAALATPLAAAGISLLLIATYDTDYVFVREESLERALAALTAAGHRIAR